MGYTQNGGTFNEQGNYDSSLNPFACSNSGHGADDGNPGQHMTQQQQQQYNPQMMGGYGMGPQMMGSCGMHMPFGGMSGPYFSSNEEFTKFLDNTKDLRRKMHALMFEFSEAARSTDPDKEKLQAIVKEMNELRTEIFNYKIK